MISDANIPINAEDNEHIWRGYESPRPRHHQYFADKVSRIPLQNKTIFTSHFAEEIIGLNYKFDYISDKKTFDAALLCFISFVSTDCITWTVHLQMVSMGRVMKQVMESARVRWYTR